MGDRYQNTSRTGGGKMEFGKEGTGKHWAASRERFELEQNEEKNTFSNQDMYNGYPSQSYTQDDDERILRHQPGAEFNPTTGTYMIRNSKEPRKRMVWPWIILAFAVICICYVAFNRSDPVTTSSPSGNAPAVAAAANTIKPTENFFQNTVRPNTAAPLPSPKPAVIQTSIPSPTQTPVPAEDSAVLKYGSKGDAVKTLQGQLIELGYIALGGDDGAFGDGTLTALKSFQKENGLEADGIAGKKTLDLINGGTAKKDPDVFVWVVSKGKVYHSSKDCSNMKDPKQIKLSQAEKRKLKPCDKCN